MRGRLCTVDLLIEVACFVKKNINHIFNIKREWTLTDSNKLINYTEPSLQ
jgi:hypothetical protein